jgi:hypothetical protein
MRGGFSSDLSGDVPTRAPAIATARAEATARDGGAQAPSQVSTVRGNVGEPELVPQYCDDIKCQ